MLVLEDGQIAFGDCADVILAGVAGRDPAFNARDHIDYVRGEVADALRGRDVSKFRDERRGDGPLRARRRAPAHRDPLRREPGAAARDGARPSSDDGGSHRPRIRLHDRDRAHPDTGVVPQGRSRTARPRDPEARRAAAARLLPGGERARRAPGREAGGVRAARRAAHQGNRRRGLSSPHPRGSLRDARRALLDEDRAARRLPGQAARRIGRVRAPGRVAHDRRARRRSRSRNSAACASCSRRKA